MRCRNCRKFVFDFRDGTLEARNIDMVEGHLEACAPCREFYTQEEGIGRALKTAGELDFLLSGPALPAGNRACSTDRSLQYPTFGASGSPRTIIGENRQRRYRRIRRRLVPLSLAAAGILAAVFLGPVIIHRGAPAHSALDDLADPLGDWLEARMIVTIENPATGKSETFVSTRSDGVRPLPSGSAIR